LNNQDTILKVENLSKQYRLGVVGTGTISHDLNRWWHLVRGKEDPYLKIGETNVRATKGDSKYVWALKDINFEVKRGEVLGIIGKNGAGKSTLLKILSQVTGPTTGSIKSRGRIASLLEVGTGFHPELTGKENIFLNGAILGMTKAEIRSKLDEIVEFSGVSRYLDTPVKRYSSGMKVRLAFAVAAHLEPDILIVDEVLAVGDVEFQKKAIGKMKDISIGEGRTVLFVSHNMAAVKNLCTSGIVLENGMIVFEGSSDEAVKNYIKASVNLAIIPLAERKDRKGDSKLTVTNIYILKDGAKVNEVNSGDSISICFEYIKHETINPKLFTIVLQFTNDNDELVTTIATDELGTKFTSIEDKGLIEFSIPKLQFREGSYKLHFMISERISLATPHKVIDNLNNVYIMNVKRGDYWNSGSLNRPKGFIQDAQISLK